MVFGAAQLVTEEPEKAAALEAFVHSVVPHRNRDVRDNYCCIWSFSDDGSMNDSQGLRLLATKSSADGQLKLGCGTNQNGISVMAHHGSGETSMIAHRDTGRCCLQARQPTKYELKATTVLALPLAEVSAKVSTCVAVVSHVLAPS